jgi:hypothetical protein
LWMVASGSVRFFEDTLMQAEVVGDTR